MKPQRTVPALLLMVVLTACGSSSATPEEVDDDLERLRALWFGDPAAAVERDEERTWTERESAVRACMQERDQVYVARPFPRNPVVERQQAEQRALEGTRAYAERYGFGMATTMVDSEIATAYEQQFPYEDPNLIRLEGLPWQERLPFLEALLGTATDGVRSSPTPVPLDQYESTDPAAGCLHQAGGGDVGPVQLPAAAVTELEGIESRVAADPEVLAATTGWAACMRQHGYDFANRDEAVGYASEQTGGAIDIVGETGVEVRGPSGEPVTLSVVAYHEQQLQEVVALEIAVATADFDCRERSGYTPIEQVARRREQVAWIERWADRLGSAAGQQ